MNRITVSFFAFVVASLTACSSAPPQTASSDKPVDPATTEFSANPPGGLPKGWEPLIILRNKKRTDYRLVHEPQGIVLHAKAKSSASGLVQRVDMDPNVEPWLHWRWKVANLIKDADNFHSATEDSPVRIVLGFDGDKDALPFADQVMFDTAKLLTGREAPYATLMYIWENKAPVGTVIPNSRSKRLKGFVAASGAEGVGQWRSFSRNIVEDFEKAFGEKPGRLICIGVLTDTDNTGEMAEAWYGDIRFSRVQSEAEPEAIAKKP